MTFEEMQEEAHRNALDKGFWENKNAVTSLPEAIALMHSELSEALEEYRNTDIDVRNVYFPALMGKMPGPIIEDMVHWAEQGMKPEGVAIEFADCVIRIMDNCEALGIPLKTAIEMKMAYNRTRPYRHGGKRI
jgi:NTP pyrophosphatase (non-canonical NTP hydrolase)